MPFAEHQEWPFQGLLKRTRIGTETKYNLEFKFPCISKLINLPTEACDEEDVPTTPMTCPNAPYSKVSTQESRPRTRVGWKAEDDTRLVDMKRSGCSWKEIYAAFPDRTPGTIHVRCSTRLKTVLLKATSIIPRPVAPASLTKPQLCLEVNNTSRGWDVREFIGKEYVDVLQYIVEWCPTLESVHSLEHAKELVDEFEARLLALRKDKKG